jgi:DNA modification methylase
MSDRYDNLSREELIRLLVARDRRDGEFVETTKVYQLAYKGKTPKQNVLAETPAAPFQEVRSFNADNPCADGWRNLLIYGDNLIALKTLYDDQRGPNRYGTRNKIKLIYIDPPFATKQDFMKDREKAYRDKVIGAQFIEFLRKRLILLREVLAEDGSIYVHLDWKKGHYIKAVLDEVFGEENFQNEIIWQRTNSHNETEQFGRVHDTVFFYMRGTCHIWHPKRVPFSEIQLKRYRRDEKGRLYTTQDLCAERRNSKSGKFNWRGTMPPPTRGWGYKIEQLEQWWSEGRIAKKKDGTPRMDGLIVYLDKTEGQVPQSIWTDVGRVANTSAERIDYPTQKSEALLERIIEASSNPGDIVLDAFAGSGTTPAVAEKMRRRWIAMDCGKLAIYTIQRRMLELTTQVGARAADDRLSHERVSDFAAHLKSPAQGLVMVSEKVRKGELALTDEFLKDLAGFLKKHGGRKSREFSLVCPREALALRELKAEEPGGDDKAGEQVVTAEGVRFLISFIEPKEKPEKEQPLKAREFALLNAGVYDNERIKAMPWQEYKPFVMRLFGVRDEPHKIHAFMADGYIGTDSAFVWNYPEQKNLTVDEEYVATLHKALGGRAGDRFYVIAPVVSMGFMMDEVTHGETAYVFLKVPISILRRLLESDEHGAIRQPVSEADVNEVIDAIGFDFVSQPVVKAQCRRAKPEKEELFNRHQKDYLIRLKEFRFRTLATDPEDFGNFETLSMILMDPDFRGDIFRLGKVYWAEDLVKAELARVGATAAGSLAEQAALCKQLDLRIPEADFTGKKLMVIFVDKYGNEKKEVYARSDFA